jgi:hypothetical protein
MEKKNYFYLTEIDALLDSELEKVNLRFDEALESSTLNEDKIKMASAERITIKRIKILLKNEMEL